MNPERWQAVGELFEHALSLPAGERTACIDRESGGDDELRREVLSLLASHKSAPGGFVQEKIKNAVLSFHETKLVGTQTTQVGPYRLIRELGRGGMGTVFLAERDDDQYKATVAIKLVRPGMDTEFILARFRRERQTLARLQHPNIARLLDGGTTRDTLPYIVMEYVDGPAITRYAEQQKLGVTARVVLFLSVCSAVDYAHRNFVIHRDLKPGNVLVDSQGVPKLLDFGICKLLHSDTLSAVSGGETMPGLMTPNYASPEQFRGEAVTLLSDVYSLGVLLYELLTEKCPRRFTGLTAQDIAGAGTQVEILLPSAAVEDKALTRQLSGDLDNILMRALDAETQRRYESAALFADDLRRYLLHEPVRARPQTWRYRALKFVRRNQARVTAAAAVFVILAGALAVSLREARNANARLAQVRSLANKLVFDVHDAVHDLPGATPARRVIVQTAITYLDSAAAAAKGDAQAESELAGAYRKLGDVQGNAIGANLGDPAGAMVSYDKALALLENIIRRKPSDIAAQTERLVLYHRIGVLQAYTGKTTDGVQTFQNAILIGTPLLVSAGNPFKSALADLYIESCDAKRNMGNVQGSLHDASEALRLYREIQASGTATPAMLQSLATADAAVGMAESKVGRLPEALRHFREGTEQMEQLSASQPHNASLRRDLMLAYGHVADVSGNPNLENLGDRAGALTAYRRAAEIGKALYDADPANEQAGADYGIVLSRVATAMDDGDLEAKVAAYRESLRVLDNVARISPTNVSLQLYRAYGNQQLGDTLKMSGNHEAAEKAYEDAGAIAESSRKSGQIAFVTLVVMSNLRLAQNSIARAHRGEALVFARRAFEASTELPHGTVSPFMAPRGLAAMGLTYAALARSPLRQPNDRDQALSWLHKSLDGWHRVQAEPSFSAIHQREVREVEDMLAKLERR
jgi:eukaryotic-like serine/threonine-protein kinase